MTQVTSGEQIGSAAIAGVVDRPRLYRILDAPLVRLCVVQGPSGSGKTTLLRSWLLQRGERDAVAWVSLSAGIVSRAMFWQHVVGSAERLGEMSKETADEVRAQLSIGADPVRIATTLLSGVGPAVLVLDAYEHLGQVAAEIDEDVAQLVAAVPELRVMVTTRSGTALTDAVVPDGVTRVIALNELALTPDEVGALIATQAGLTDERLAQSVAGATRGFPLTVRAVALALSQLGRIPRAESREWNAVVAAKLESLLPDPAAVRFVADTSVPPYVDAALAQELSGNPDTMSVLSMLERNGFGRWVPYALDRPVFQYVETIRDAFRRRAAGAPERFRRSCVTTALWLLANEEVPDQALQLAIEGGDYALADRVFVSLVISNPESYITDRFLPSLREVPDAALQEYPMLAFGLGLALMTNPILRLEAPRAFRIAGDSPMQRDYLEPDLDAFTHASMQSIAHRLAREYRVGADAGLAAARRVDAMDPVLVRRFGEHVGTVLRQLSFSIWQGGRLEEAIAAANRSVALCAKPASRTYSTVYSAGMSGFAGDTARAGALMASIDVEAWPPEMRATSMNGLGLLAEAYVRLDALDFAGASEVLHDSDPYMRTNEYWPFLTAAWVYTRLGLGHARAEAERVTTALNAPTAPPGVGDNVATEQLHAAVALAWMAGGDARAAGRMLELQPVESPHAAGARVAVLLAADRDRAALEETQRLLEVPGHTIRTRAETHVVGAVAALRQGASDLAWAWLGGAAVAEETYGTRMHLAMLDPRDRRRLREFARERDSSALQRYLDVPGAASRLSRAAGELTGRERVVLVELAAHSSIGAVAQALSVSPHTIKTQLQSIYRKLGVSSRQAAVSAANELGLLEHRSSAS